MRVALSLCVLGLVVGCNGDDTVNIDTTKDNFCDQIAEVACHNAYQCCTESEIESLLRVSDPRTELQCRDDVAVSCKREAATLFDSLKAGRVTFDASRLNACLGSVLAPQDTCAEVVTEYPWKTACKDSAWVGTVTIGGSCFFNFDCAGAPDNFCAPTQKCAAKPTAGLPCDTGCASAFYCGTGNICQPRLAAGAMCTFDGQCATDLYCDLNASPVPVCAAKGPGGSSCSSSQGCISNECIPGKCQGTNSSCYRDTQCNPHCANSTLFCTTSANCSTGTCSNGSGSCTSDLNCVSPNTCVFPISCLPGDCIGDPVCTSSTLTVDYCDAIGNVPLL